MANKKKELVSAAKNLIDDIFDHYDDYSIGDKKKIQNVMDLLTRLNFELDSYDNPKRAQKRKSIFEKFVEAVGDFFGTEQKI